jgi:omega-amidase
MRIYGLQLDIAWEDKSTNYRRIEQLVEELNPEVGSLLVLPEMSCTGFSRNLAVTAEPMSDDRATGQFYSRLARKHSITLLGGETVLAKSGRGANLCSAWGPDGGSLTTYQKTHPFSFGGESEFFDRGNRLRQFEWNGIRVAPYVCYDLRFPEIFRMQAECELIVVIANWPAVRDYHWRSLLVARAIENQAYLIGVNRVGSDPKLEYCGSSIILDPQGEILAQAGSLERFITAELDLSEQQDYRKRFPALQDRLAIECPALDYRPTK